MAKLSELIETAAGVLGKPVPTVTLIARHLREDELLSSGGRGRGGAEMTAQDMVNLILGVVCSNQTKDAPQTVRAYRSAKCVDQILSSRAQPARWSKVWMAIANPDFSLGTVLDTLAECFVTGILGRALFDEGGGAEISRENPAASTFAVVFSICAQKKLGVGIEFNLSKRTAKIVITDSPLHPPLVTSIFKFDDDEFDSVGSTGDLIERRSISTVTFLFIGELFQRSKADAARVADVHEQIIRAAEAVSA